MVLRKAQEDELPLVWEIILYAKEQRRLDGSKQWQDGYPNEESIKADFKKGHGYVVDNEGEVIAYGAIIYEVEPAYNDIEGEWLTEGDYVCVHRVAASPLAKGKSIGKFFFNELESLAKSNNVFSIKVDTNFDNNAMLKILADLGYTYCGEVFFRGGARKAFEKVLK